MQSERIISISAMALAVLAMCLISIVPDGIDGTEQTYDKDYGQFYSYTLQFVFDGGSAESISWDFGDGSQASTEWNPSHTYAAVGTYYVTQTTTNSYNGISTTVQTYKVQIMGYPVITFESNGGSAVQSIQQSAYKITAVKPADPTRSGYTFGGWYTDTNLTTEYNWSKEVTTSFTLYAKWNGIVTYTVTFDSDGGSSVVSQTVESGSSATIPQIPTKEGYTFGGWFLGDVQYDFSLSVTRNISLKAHWTDNTAPVTVTKYTVSYNVDGGSQNLSQTEVDSGSRFTFPGYTGTKEGYTFKGWQIGTSTYQAGNQITVTGNLILKAVWQKNADVSVDDKDKDKDKTSEDKKDILADIEDFAKAHLILIVVILAVLCILVFAGTNRRR